MNPYYNLPMNQRAVQRLADALNADESAAGGLWQSLFSSRKRRRKKLKKLPNLPASGLAGKLHQLLEMLEFERKRSLDACIGFIKLESRR